MVTVGAPAAPDTVARLLADRRQESLAGSAIGGLRDTQEMLDFCAAHDVRPAIELIPAADVDGAYDRVVNSDVRYRFVIDAATIS